MPPIAFLVVPGMRVAFAHCTPGMRATHPLVHPDRRAQICATVGCMRGRVSKCQGRSYRCNWLIVPRGSGSVQEGLVIRLVLKYLAESPLCGL